MPQRLDPPSHYPVRDLSRSPNHRDALYWELISRDSVEYQANTPIKRGTPYATIRGAKQSIIDAYPNGLWFCEEIVPLRSSEVGGMPGHQFVIWVWSTDRAAQSQTNANITYSSESITHPIYARERIVRRDAYEADPTDAVASSLTALIGVTITNAGSGYTYATGTVGTATVEFVVSAAGTLIAGIVTNEGSGIGSGAAITITGDGAAATATAVIQPATAILVHQEKRELSQDSNLSHEFVLVVLVYETLPGPTLTGQEYNEQLDIVSTYTEKITTSGWGIGAARTEVRPIDTARDKVRTITVPTDALAAFVQRFPGTINLNLPDELVSVTAIFDVSGDNSTSSETGYGSATGTSASLSLACHSSTETGVAVIPDIQIDIAQTWAQNVPIEHFFFFLIMPVTTANIITKLNAILTPLTVASWPTFKPVAHTVSILGGRCNARATASVQQHVALSTETAARTYSIGTGTSLASGVVIKTIRIPPTIHPLVNIDFAGTPNPYTLTKTATARAQLEAATNWPHVDSEPVVASASVEATIDPVSFAATASQNTIPASGLYIKDVDVEPWRYGYARVHAAVFDFASI